MKEKLLQLLACPECSSDLEFGDIAERSDSEIVEGILQCTGCAKTFPITRGVPRFADLGAVEKDKAETAENFGWQWQHFTQEDNRYADQFLGWIGPVQPGFFKDKLVVEGGCGKGRHTQLAAGWGAREVVGVDLSAAVESAYQATRDLPNAHIVQADIYKLPLKAKFDYGFSVGVLHHLPGPRAGFISLSTKIRRGGALSAWVYGAENNGWITSVVNPVRTKVTSKIPPGVLLHLSKIPTIAVYAATKLLYGPLNRSAATAGIASHLFYNDYLNAIAGFGWREQHTIVFDHLVAPTAFYISKEEFTEWWRAIDAKDVVISWHNKNSWRGFGHLPGDASETLSLQEEVYSEQ